MGVVVEGLKQSLVMVDLVQWKPAMCWPAAVTGGQHASLRGLFLLSVTMH